MFFSFLKEALGSAELKVGPNKKKSVSRLSVSVFMLDKSHVLLVLNAALLLVFFRNVVTLSTLEEQPEAILPSSNYSSIEYLKENKTLFKFSPFLFCVFLQIFELFLYFSLYESCMFTICDGRSGKLSSMFSPNP